MYIIGISGGSGSGKTTLAEAIASKVNAKVKILSLDMYYKDFPDLPFDERSRLNYDRPDIFDFEMMEADLRTLLRGESIELKEYNYVEYRREPPAGRMCHPPDVLIFEGLHMFYVRSIRELIDLKIYINLDPDIAILRRLRRDISERGRTVDSVIEQYLKTVKPSFERYIRPYSTYADIILPNLENPDMTPDIIAAYVNSIEL